jgi:hypothetical protein
VAGEVQDDRDSKLERSGRELGKFSWVFRLQTGVYLGGTKKTFA